MRFQSTSVKESAFCGHSLLFVKKSLCQRGTRWRQGTLLAYNCHFAVKFVRNLLRVGIGKSMGLKSLGGTLMYYHTNLNVCVWAVGPRL